MMRCVDCGLEANQETMNQLGILEALCIPCIAYAVETREPTGLDLLAMADDLLYIQGDNH